MATITGVGSRRVHSKGEEWLDWLRHDDTKHASRTKTFQHVDRQNFIPRLTCELERKHAVQAGSDDLVGLVLAKVQ